MTPNSNTSAVWKRKRLSDIFEIRASGDMDWVRWSRVQDSAHPHPVFANGRAESGLHGYASYAVEQGDAITVTARGTLGELGFAFFRAAAFTPIGRLLVLRSKGEADACFFASYINCIIRFAQENTGVAQLTAPQVIGYEVDVPPMEEQRAIATALSDVDALLAKIDQLIVKKRDLKQAAMQQLLTGKTRLPGFSGEWKATTFGQVAQPRRDRIDPRSAGMQQFCVELEHIAPASGALLGSTSTGEQASLKSAFSAGDVLFGKLRAYLRKYWLATRSGVCSTEIWVLAPNSRLMIAEFLFQIVKTDDFVEAASNSYGTHMPRSDWTIVKNFELALPPLPEQSTIATVLSDMDAELAALEVRRDKTRSLKQGMMQALLTGRIRLVGVN